MFAIRSVCLGAMYGVLQVASAQRALVAMVGSMAMESWGEDHLGRLLVDAVGGMSDRLGEGAPSRLAEALVAQLAVDGGPGDGPTWLLFAAALVRPGAVDVCHAGDLRVQLIRGGAVVEATVDHTLGNQPGAALPEHASVVVRSLQRGGPAAERTAWPLGDGAARLMIASYEVHGHRPARQRVEFPDGGFASRYQSGAAIEIDMA